MQITIDTNNLSPTDIAVLALLLQEADVSVPETEAPKPAPAKKATPAKVAAPKAEVAPDPELEPEPTEEAEPEADGPTMSDAVAAATQLVSAGEAARVKAALAEVGAKRVSEMKVEDIPTFLAALEA